VARPRIFLHVLNELRIIVEEDPSAAQNLNAYCADAAAGVGLESYVHGAPLDALGRHFTDQPCPSSYGIDATKRFMADLQDAMISTKWKADPKDFGML
jgi:hypothetical protein